jgi:hypothetical protein
MGLNMNIISFRNTNTNDSNEYVEIVTSQGTWPEVAETFFNFLQGVGYVLTREEFADYWSQYLESSCCNRCAQCDEDF